ncbi:IclR family transcriptional regulator (plasmid) [Gemmobacter fulvus]|uniref:IclR family transcriptional regulator n=1 Tax=Gemmobacter fulvus TaxID=2840474 RepID=A0A975PBJ9_9RHOB|nr:IclR family transcriptional regulator [Gemmobacter fulvus]MBT9246258.1 IclR family transcriptional regulator [Gemmobacter fulvus]QWK92386.1 IclR family transcriptional regulator [Gemmobacter fulvus]
MGTTSKALALLEFFTRQRPSIGLSDLARLSGANKATCFRLMSELVEHGIAEQLPTTKEYRIGPAVLRLAALREASVPTREAALPVLQALAVATGETAHMSHLVAGQLVTLAFAYSSSHGMRVMMEDADVLPFHATSSGFATLAWMGEAEVARILAAPLPARTTATPATPEAVRDRLAATRRDGLAQTAATFEADVNSFAVPLFDAQGIVQGAMAVAAPALRMTDVARDQIPRQLIAAAVQVMALWGGQIPPDLAALWRGRTDPTGQKVQE